MTITSVMSFSMAASAQRPAYREEKQEAGRAEKPQESRRVWHEDGGEGNHGHQRPHYESRLSLVDVEHYLVRLGR